MYLDINMACPVLVVQKGAQPFSIPGAAADLVKLVFLVAVPVTVKIRPSRRQDEEK